MWADYQWRIPVPSERFFATGRLRLNPHAFTRPFVEPNEDTILKRGVNRVRIFRINSGVKKITAIRYKPVRVNNAGDATRTRRTAKAKVVLRAAVDVVERCVVVGSNVVELRDRKIGFKLPIRAAIVTFINTTVGADQIMIVVARVNPDLVIVNMLRFLAETPQCSTAIIRNHQKDVHDVDSVHVLWMGNDARVVHRAGVKLVSSLPTAAAISRAKDPALAIAGLYGRVKNIRIDRRDRQADAPQVDGRQAGLQLI